MRLLPQRSIPLVLLAATAFCVPAQAGSGWLTNLEKGKKAAKKSKLPILVEFTGSDWCKPCKVLEKEVFQSKEFKKEAKAFVLVQLDYPQRKPQDKRIRARNQRLMSKYKVEGFPTVLVLDYEGKELGRTVGYQAGSQKKWRAQIGKILQNFDAETGKAKPGDHSPKARPKAPPAREKKLTAPAGSGKWETSYAKAVELARSSGKPILADFTGSDWCGWCVKLKKEVFDTAEFKRWAKAKVVLLELDFPSKAPQSRTLKEQNKKLAAKYKVEGFPTILFLDASGKVVGRTGYVAGGPKAWIAQAEKALKGR
jgi:thioredoxin-related protein